MEPLKIGITGAAGRMGAMLVRQVQAQGTACRLIGATERDGSAAIGRMPASWRASARSASSSRPIRSSCSPRPMR